MEAALTLPIKVERIIDGDTVEVSVQIRTNVRLLDCWAPERNTEEGKASTANLSKLCLGKTGWLSIPYNSGEGFGQILSLGRVLGRVQVDGVDCSIAQCAAGVATEHKPTEGTP